MSYAEKRQRLITQGGAAKVTAAPSITQDTTTKTGGYADKRQKLLEQAQTERQNGATLGIGGAIGALKAVNVSAQKAAAKKTTAPTPLMSALSTGKAINNALPTANERMRAGVTLPTQATTTPKTVLQKNYQPINTNAQNTIQYPYDNKTEQFAYDLGKSLGSANPNTIPGAVRYGLAKGVQGVAGAAEGIADLAYGGGSAALGWLTSLGGLAPNSFAQGFTDNAKKAFETDIAGSIGKGIADKSEVEIAKPIQFGGDVYNVAGNLLAGLGVGKAASGVTKLASDLTSKLAIGASAGGQGAQQAYQEGASVGEALTYGAAAGMLEASIESIAGGIPGLGKGVVGKAVEKLTSKAPAAVRAIMSAAGEGAEEVLSDFITPYLQRIVYNPEAENATLEQMAKDFALGAGLSGLIQGAGAIGNINTAKSNVTTPQTSTQSTANNVDIPTTIAPNVSTKVNTPTQNAVQAPTINSTENEVKLPTEAQNDAQGVVEPVSESVAMEQKLNSLREERDSVLDFLDAPFLENPDADIKRAENRLVKLDAEIDKLVAEERRASVKTPLKTIFENIEKYRRSDLESLAEQMGDGNWDGYEDLTRSELEDALREVITERMGEMSILEAQHPKNGLFVRPIDTATTPSTPAIFPENSLGAKITNGMPQGVGAASKGSQGGMGATKPTRFEVNDETDSDLENLPEMSNKVVMTPQKKSGTLKTKLDNLYTRTVDTLNPIVKFSKATGDKTAMLASNSVNAGGTVSHIIENALVDMDGNKIGNSLKDVVSKVPKGEEVDFWNYMMQRRNIYKAREDKNVIANYNTRKSAKHVENVEAQHPEWKKTGDEVVKWISDFQQAWSVKSGLVDGDFFEQLQLRDPNYVPAQREFTDVEAAFTGHEVGRKFIDQNAPIKKMQGSDRDINNPVENIMRLVNTTVKTARYNQVGQSLLNTLRNNPNASKYGEIISAEEASASNTNNIVTVIENGQKNYIRINDVSLLEALNGMPKSTYTVPVLSNLTTGFKKLTTQDNPLFGFTNFARDLPTGYIYGSQWNPFAYLLNEGKAFGQIATNGKMYQKYKAVGGGMSSFFSSADAETAALNLTKTKNVFQKVSIGFNKFNSMIEEATRLNEFSAVFSKTGDVQKALNAANDVTVNFARGGDITKTVDRNGVAYLNASIQGLDKLGKAFMPERVAKTLLTGAVGITLPTLILYLFNRDNPYYDELSNRTKDNYFCIPNMFGETDDNGNAMTFIKVPKSRELGVIFGALAERIAREVDGEEEAFKGFGSALATNIAPANPLDSGVVGPLINLRSNKDFAGRTIVPQSMQDRSKYLQFDEKTSELTKYIAEYANKVGIELSPKEMDYLIDSWTGVVGDFLLPATTKGANPLSPITNRFTADPRYSNQTITDFYEKMEKAAQKATDKNLVEGLDSDTVTLEEKISSNYAKASKEMSALTKVSARAGVETLTDEDKKLLSGYGIDPTKEPQDIQKAIRTQQIEIAKAAIGRGTKADEMELDINNNSNIAKSVEKYQSAGISQKQAYTVYKAFEALEPEAGASEVSVYQKIRTISGFGYSDKQAIALVGTLYTDKGGESMLPHLTTAKNLLSLYLTTKDTTFINKKIPSEFSLKGTTYVLTDNEKKVYQKAYANWFNSHVTNVSTTTDILKYKKEAEEKAEAAVINSR